VRRLPALAFCAIVAATVFGFFLTDILKTAPPLVVGYPQPIPAAFNPVSGRVCKSRTGQPLNYRRTSLSLKLFHTGTVAVYVIDNAGDTVANISAGRYLQRFQPAVFFWKGFENGGRIAPDGTYFFKLLLVQQGRSIDLSQYPITVMTHDPRAPTTAVALTAAATGGTAQAGTETSSGPPVLTPPTGSVTIDLRGGTGGPYRRVWIDVYRTDLPNGPKLVYRFRVNPTHDSTTWDGTLKDGVPAPAGTYLLGVTVQDLACNPAHYPVTVALASGTKTPGAGVTVRYLAATPPLTPTPAGSLATVLVSSPTGPFTWALRLAGKGAVLARGQAGGSTGSAGVTLRVRLPKANAGLYTLTLSTGRYSTAVPLVASATRARAARGRAARQRAARVLVVLPMLTWQGENPVDDTGDGLPDTLSAGDRIPLDRPLAENLPQGFRQDSALIAYLNSRKLHYQLTTDVALAQGVGPSLAGNDGVVLAGSETWLPDSLLASLKRFVRAGGSVLSLDSGGLGSFRGSSRITGDPSDPVASPPTAIPPDPFGARALLAGITDGSGAATASELGRGYMVEVAAPDFSSTLASSLDSQELLDRIWQLLAK
jgi:hypothetical protein